MRALPLFLALLAMPAWAAGDFGHTAKVGAGGTVVDTRPLAECQAAALPDARCLPPAEFLGPRGELPNERDLLWLLGTAGLDGSERVVVTGDNASAREFVAGVLYLAGQRDVRILDAPLTPLVKAHAGAAEGRTRALVRSSVFTAPMRDDLWIVARHEVDNSPAILAADAYTSIRRFVRHLLDTGEARRVGWALDRDSR